MLYALQNAALLLTLVLPVALASPKPCSDHPGVVHDSSSPYYSGGSSSGAAAVSSGNKGSKGGKGGKGKSGKTSGSKGPKVNNPTIGSVSNGASEAVNQFSPYLPSEIAGQLQDALNQAIKNQLQTPTVVTVTATQTITQLAETARTTVVPANITVINGTTSTIAPAYTSTIPLTGEITHTKTVANQTITTFNAAATDAASIAALNIGKAIQSAFAAVNMSQSGLNDETIQSLESCLSTVLAAGGMPSGYSCLTESGSTGTGLATTLRTTLEQFVGILPNQLITNMFDAIDPLLSTLLPASEYSLVQQIQDSIASVIATASGSSVTALEQVQDCYTNAIQQKGNTSALACYATSAQNQLTTMTNGMLESFVGVLPASLMTSVQNILNYNLADSTGSSNADLAAKVQAQISNALNSAASTLSGNTVTLAETLQQCTSQLILTGNSTAAKECITSGQAPALSQTVVLGIAEQFQGYLPSSFFTDLVQESSSLLNTSANAHNRTAAQINAAFESYFNNATSYGAAFVTCFAQVQNCVTNAIVKSGTLAAICPGPVAGCKPQSSKRLIKKSVPANSVRAINHKMNNNSRKRSSHHDAVFDPSKFVSTLAEEAVAPAVKPASEGRLLKRSSPERVGKMHNLEKLRRTE